MLTAVLLLAGVAAQGQLWRPVPASVGLQPFPGPPERSPLAVVAWQYAADADCLHPCMLKTSTLDWYSHRNAPRACCMHAGGV